ncbi:hypothetical protein AAHE18_20G233600 [Arachis hypogaea]
MENPTLKKVGKDLVKKCDGLPLAAQALGGLLRGNFDVKYWNHLLKSEIWELSDDKIKRIFCNQKEKRLQKKLVMNILMN